MLQAEYTKLHVWISV